MYVTNSKLDKNVQSVSLNQHVRWTVCLQLGEDGIASIATWMVSFNNSSEVGTASIAY